MERKEKPENIEAMKKGTVELMQRLTVRDRQLVYMYAYRLVVEDKHRGDPAFVREPLPPAEALRKRVENILREATEKEVKYIFFWAMAKRQAEKRKPGEP